MNSVYSQKIFRLYSDYISWSVELMRSFGGVKIFTQLFTGGAQYKNREEHMEFFKDVEDAAGEFFYAIKECTVERDELLDVLQYVLLVCHEGVDEWGDWMLLAAEKHFVPFADLLSREEAVKLYEPYRKLRRRNKGLPPQEDILKKLKKLSK